MGLYWRFFQKTSYAFLSICLILVGCSSIPEQVDVTDIPMREIVQKVVCEVKEELQIQAEERNFSHFFPRIEQIETQIAKLNSKKLDDEERKKLELKQENLLAKEAELILIGTDITAKLKGSKAAQDLYEQELEKRTPQDPAYTKFLQLFYQAQTDLIKYDEQSGELKKLLRENKTKLNDTKESLQKDKDAINQINAGEKYLKTNFSQAIGFLGNAILLDFDFDITENNNATGAANFIMPVQFGTFTVGIDAGDKKARKNVETIYVYSTFEDIFKQNFCDPLGRDNPFQAVAHSGLVRTSPPRQILYPVSGNLHTGEIVKQYLELQDDGLKYQERDKVHSRAILFTTILNGAVKPSFSIAPIPKGFNTISGNLDLVADRTDSHKVTVRLRPQVEQASGKIK